MSKALQRELKLFFLIPKNIYLPISIFGIIFVIFLVLDLDNTLWGGVIGDDGVAKIKIGNDTPVSEAYLDFQKY